MSCRTADTDTNQEPEKLCGKCQKKFRKALPVKCVKCLQSFHKTSCTDESREVIDEIVKKKKHWTCKACRGITREEEAERRQVRRRYNDLKQRVKNRRFQQVTDLSDVIKETDELLEEVERKDMTAREAVLDANVFKLISTRCREQAQVSI